MSLEIQTSVFHATLSYCKFYLHRVADKVQNARPKPPGLNLCNQPFRAQKLDPSRSSLERSCHAFSQGISVAVSLSPHIWRYRAGTDSDHVIARNSNRSERCRYCRC